MDLGNGLRIALSDQGYHVTWVRTLSSAKDALAEPPDIVVLDLGLPDGDGMTLLALLQRCNDGIPVIVITASDRLEDCTRGLDSGADDYVVKPFALQELLSRIRALARRTYGLRDDVLALRGLKVHPPTMRVTVCGDPVDLTRSEFQILLALLKRVDRIIPRQWLETQVWRNGQSGESNALEVHISNIRRKIGDGFIRTVRGVGYVIERSPAGEAA